MDGANRVVPHPQVNKLRQLQPAYARLETATSQVPPLQLKVDALQQELAEVSDQVPC